MSTITKARELLATLLVACLLALTTSAPSHADSLHAEPDFAAVDAYVGSADENTENSRLGGSPRAGRLGDLCERLRTSSS